ncbi:MAG TPA: hypothetical protein VGC35_04870 [Allosphingosinicella sp.]|jgi:hypothetical protein
MTSKSSTSEASPAPIDEDDSVMEYLSPENRVAYRQAKLALVQAEVAYAEATRAAEVERSKPQLAFEAAKNSYRAAGELKNGEVARAKGILTRLRDKAGDLHAKDLDDPKKPEEGSRQIAKLQGILDEYKAAVAAVAVQMQLVDDARMALLKLSDPSKPGETVLNPMAQRIADEQMKLAIAQAQIPLDAATDAFELKRSELEGSKPRKMH